MKQSWSDRITLYSRYGYENYLYRVSVTKDKKLALYGLQLDEKLNYVSGILAEDGGLEAVDPEGGPFMEIGREVGVGYQIENITQVPNFGYFLALTQM